MLEKKLIHLTSFLVFASLMILCSGCANWGATEPVLGGGGGYQGPQTTMVSNPRITPEVTTARADDLRMARELAGIKADMRTLQEDQKMLLARLESMELAIQAKDLQVKELQNLLSAMDGRFGEVDKEWQGRMEKLRVTMEQDRAQRRQELENVTSVMATEISKVAADRTPPPAPAATGGAYKEIVVQRGDTLSGIAAAAGTSIAVLKQFNGLKTDVIKVGDKLKIPVRE